MNAASDQRPKRAERGHRAGVLGGGGAVAQAVGVGGVLGGVATCIAAAGTIFDLLAIYRHVADFWTVVRDFAVTVLAALLSLPEINEIDALFLTLLAFLLLSFLSTMRRGRRLRLTRARPVWFAAFLLGVGVVFFVFSQIETALFVRAANAGGDIEDAYSTDFYVAYYAPLGISAWLAEQTWAIERIGNLGVYLVNRMIFYSLVGMGVLGTLFVLAFVLGYSPSARGLAWRIWIIVGLCGAAIAHGGADYRESVAHILGGATEAEGGAAQPAADASPNADDTERGWTRY